ncbi:MAG: hypothetical protein HPY45_09185 [Anaerolineae bacterium]|nr:hypothetical protein [Anaerolineae bacterium]
MLSKTLTEVLPVALWAALWTVGGWWLVRRAFHLRPNEQALAGLGVGLILQTWLANLLAQITPLLPACWLAAATVFVLGLALSFPLQRDSWRELFSIQIRPLQWITLALLAYVFIVVGRGLAILDDYQNLPIVSLIATGDIPPRFALDPKVSFSYHYFTALFAAQLVQLGNLYVWTALDVARGFGFALSILLTGLWVQRITGNMLAAYLGGLMATFAGGTRWLLLIFPQSIIERISAQVQMIGSGAGSGENLAAALLNPWASFGGGPYPFPFAYVNGFNATPVMTYHAGAGGLPGVIGGVLFLAHNRWHGWRAGVLLSALLAASALANEVTFATLGLGYLLVILLEALRRRSLRLPPSLARWLGILLPAGVISLFQGGVITGLAQGWLAKLSGAASGPAYFDFKFSLFWPPAVLSSHLGYLTLTNPWQAFLALLEIGPIIIVLPLVIVWGSKALRYQRWFEASLIGISIASLVLSFVELSSKAGITALTRAQGMIVGICSSFAVPALWLWGRKRSEGLKIWIGLLLFITMLGGMVLFGIQMIAAPLPVYSNFLNQLDAQATRDYWNRLEPQALIFDPVDHRAPVVFGRPTDSSLGLYTRKPEWEKLVEDPVPSKLHAYGFDYAYLDLKYWDSLPIETQKMLETSCMRLIREYKQEFPPDFRRLYNLQECQ